METAGQGAAAAARLQWRPPLGTRKAKMLPLPAETRRRSTLFIRLAPPGRAPLAKDSLRGPRSPRRPAAPEPPRPSASGGGAAFSSPSCGPSSPVEPAPGAAAAAPPPPPPPPPSAPAWVEPFVPAAPNARGAWPAAAPQTSSAFPADLRHTRIPSSSLGRAGETEALVERAVSPDICAFCHKTICSWVPAIQAMNKQYHAECFLCRVCHSALAGQPFFQKEGRPLCAACYKNTLEKCAKCQALILDQIVRAVGSRYHPECFVCVECDRSIVEESFAVDEEGGVHCLDDFYRKFAYMCSACEKPITPSKERDSYRIECLGRSFHEDCYRCQASTKMGNTVCEVSLGRLLVL
ncbi:filamin-binding LIM protein 1 isoform X2 [Eublepharis macularius]|uniref:Filamin-binding LIM protein 1 isoform X2 n=1 Tax=Eublepharis macularius TaxID=481883 RepID=A0AA97KLS6_EUBMA|nr:filamin-binding LIM protein 1 isoform X2 [Eublepharis macularius]